MSTNESMNPTFKILPGNSYQELIQDNEFEKNTNTYQICNKKKKGERIDAKKTFRLNNYKKRLKE